jgi:hypothetical protein
LISLLPDEYERRARLKPVLLLSLPPTLAVMSWFPDFSRLQVLAGVLAYFGLTALLSQLGRDQGKRKEPGLFVKWNGKPTTQLMRHSSTYFDAETKQRYRRAMTALLPQISLPSVDAEISDPDSADAKYDSCATFLRERTRDKTLFPLVFAENVNYGFRRNLWGMRSAGLVLSLVALIASVVAAIFFGTRDRGLPILPVFATLINACMLTLWLLRINSVWVRVAAFAYAERLLATCDTLHCESNATSKIISP